MNKKLAEFRVGILLLAFLLCAGILAGCGKDDKNGTDTTVTVTPTATSSATPTPTPTPAREPKDYSLAELYETVGKDNLYRILTADAPVQEDGDEERVPDCQILNAETTGDYVLACLRNNSGEDERSSGEYVLFHLGRPDLTRRLIPGYRDYEACLLEDGTVEIWDTDGKSVHVYNREFEEIKAFSPQGDREEYFVDFSEDGLMWFSAGDEEPVMIAYDTDGTCLGRFPYNSEFLLYSCTGIEDGNYYFLADAKGIHLMMPMVLKKGATELVTMDEETLGVSVYGMIVSGQTDTLWFLHRLGDIEGEVYFPKEAYRESIYRWKGNRILTCADTSARFDLSADDSAAERESETAVWSDYRVFDLDSFTRLGMLSGKELPQYKTLFSESLSAKGYVFFAGMTTKGTELLLWDLNAETPKPIEHVARIAEESVSERTKSLVAEIEKEYGISIHFDEKSVSESSFKPWYNMPIIEDERVILGLVEEVAYFVKQYPKELWREMCGTDRSGLDMYLVSDLVSTGEDIFIASGVTQTWGERLAVGYSAYGISAKTFAHETMHLMEHRIRQYGLDNGFDWSLFWAGERVSPEYGYSNGSGAPQEDGEFHGAWSYRTEEDGIDPDKIWFARTYGTWNELEDRATVMEELYDCNRKMFEKYPHLRDKAADMTAIIRGAFPCVSSSEKPLFWERAIGIIQPETRMDDWKKYPAEQY